MSVDPFASCLCRQPTSWPEIDPELFEGRLLFALEPLELAKASSDRDLLGQLVSGWPEPGYPLCKEEARNRRCS